VHPRTFRGEHTDVTALPPAPSHRTVVVTGATGY